MSRKTGIVGEEVDVGSGRVTGYSSVVLLSGDVPRDSLLGVCIQISYLFLITTLFHHHLMHIASDSHQSSHIRMFT